jgi:hypothetical protein
MRRLSVLSLPPHLVFPALTFLTNAMTLTLMAFIITALRVMTHHNGTKLYNTQHTDTLFKNTQHNGTSRNDT